jgi:4-hydroxybenzoyl-CoA reductase subunit beta
MDVLPDIALIRPRSVGEAVRAWAVHAPSRYIAGGTDLIPNLRRGLDAPRALIDLALVDELTGITAADGLRIGAGLRLDELARHPVTVRDYPVLARAAGMVAGPAHRAAASVGGNLCLDTRCVFYNQSHWWRASNKFCRKYRGDTCHVAPTGDRCHAAFSGDLAPALLVLDAEVEIAGPDETRRILLADLYADEGQHPLRLRPGELLTAIHVPPSAGWIADYAKARLRGAIDFPLAGVAVALKREEAHLTGLRVALTGTNSRPFRLDGTDQLLGRPLDDAALAALDKLVQKQVSPMRTTIAPAHYRRRVAAAMTRRLAASLYAAQK